MSKKEYQKPSMRVIELHHQTHLLAGSGNDWDGEGGYIPGMNVTDDMNKLA